ncbi:hypothetical protein [Bradyrhizobium sp. NBAIM14]|uniref:hypothetical protein n=1 Tax=Bradyrhizobium sp. NBAIM14 TaxID=2793814 RepID=UPI001CD35085|nr:hypothetical protein [Bradyrhizobium sp. NBAIM14]MCA1501844.1 hypothetical protein [Bradyrhizobium sp. NBAIM14]
MSVICFVGLIVLANLLRIEPRLQNAEIFVASISIVPILAASLQSWSDRCYSGAGRIFEAINVWCATATLLSLAAVRISRLDAWRAHSLFVATCAFLMYLGLSIARCCPATCDHPWCGTRATASRSVAREPRKSQHLLRACDCDCDHHPVSGRRRLEIWRASSYLVPTSKGGYPEPTIVVLALLLASVVVAVGICILQLELRTPSQTLAKRPVSKLIVLILGLMSIIALFIDFSLAADPFHYMTILGPALHLMHGGTLMVDTFSQYGPGPVLLAYLAFQFGPPSFSVPAVAIQMCNLAFYGLFLIALCQRTRFPTAAAWFGIILVLIWMAGWGNGEAM